MYEAAKDLLYQILLFREIGIKLVRVPLSCDNTLTIKQMMETMSSKSNKHMEIRYAWLQHYAHREGIVQPFNIASGTNLADMMTKVLPLCRTRKGTGCSNHFNVICEHVFSGTVLEYIDDRLRDGMVRGDSLNTYEAYLKKVEEEEEVQPFVRASATREA